MLRYSLMTLSDLKLNPKACNFAIRRSCFRQQMLSMYQLGLWHTLYFYQELLSPSQSELRGNVGRYSSFESHTCVKEKMYQSTCMFRHIRVSHKLFRDSARC